MKRHLKIFCLAIACSATFQSCEKWFDVTANDQIKAEDQFSSADGFKDALMGVYLVMGEQQLYGKDMTYNMMDLLAQQYNSLTNLAQYYTLQSFDYKAVRSESRIKDVWDKYYFAIANTNAALQYLEESDLKWYTGEKQIIKGELLALRAFLHFDLMRVFGHSGYANRPELASRLAIPYSMSYSKDFAPQYSYTQTFELLESDIREALDLLKYDPIYKNTLLSAGNLAEINRDGFYDNRTNRLNYYAVKALQARVFAWQGGVKMQLAAQAAEEVISDAASHLLPAGQSITNNKTISNEHLFGLKVEKLNNIVNPLLDGASNVNYNALKIPNALSESIFEASATDIGLADIRFNTLLASEPLGKISLKLLQSNPNHVDYNTIPLIKLPEMYYIAAEYYSTTNATKAIDLLQTVRASRRIENVLSSSLSLADFNEELTKEYRKEFVSEGQLFFYYKRKGFETLPNYSVSVLVDDKIYMLPFPATEVEFANRVQEW